jgi:CsoR family transcriptional regulator, copper-sensing transcriptional repressor
MQSQCDEIKNQINRLKGQLNGVDKMIDDGRDVPDILTQISALKAGLNKLAVEILKDESRVCFTEKSTEKKLQRFEDLVANLFKVT